MIIMLMLSLIVVGIVTFVVHAKIAYKEFYSVASPVFKVPEIDTGFIPQGIEYCEDEGVFLISGYDPASKILIVYPDGRYKKVSVKNADGSDFMNHSGGISATGKFIYIAGCDGKCYVLERTEAMDVGSESVQIIGSFDSYNKADFCYIHDSRLYVGEYYSAVKYKTDTTHHFTTPSGEDNHSIITVFELNDDRQYGVEDQPVEIYSATSAIQGMCFTNRDEIILSTSFLFDHSRLYIYDFSKIRAGQQTKLDINGRSIPVYYLDHNCLKEVIAAPPKSEGLVFHDRKVFIAFESASNKFVLGKLIGGEYVYSMRRNE